MGTFQTGSLMPLIPKSEGQKKRLYVLHNKPAHAAFIIKHKTIKKVRRINHIILLAFAACMLLMAPAEALAQRGPIRFLNRMEHDQRPYNFGFSLGVNTMDFSIRQQEDLRHEYDFNYVLPERRFGFHIGIVSNLKLSDQFDLRFIPAISFGERHIEYYTAATEFPNGFDNRQKLETTILEFPLHVKYKSVRMTNTRVYVIGGGKFTHDLASIEMVTGEDILARVARNDFHYEMGVGYEYYFYYFKFSAELKASFGLMDLIRPGDEERKFYTSIDRLNSKSIMLSFIFE